MLLLNVLLALLDIVGRLASRTQGFLMLKSMYGNRTAEAISALPEMDATRLAMRLSHTMTDHAGIVAASAILSFARVSGTGKARPPRHDASLASSFCMPTTGTGSYSRCSVDQTPAPASLVMDVQDACLSSSLYFKECFYQVFPGVCNISCKDPCTSPSQATTMMKEMQQVCLMLTKEACSMDSQLLDSR